MRTLFFQSEDKSSLYQKQSLLMSNIFQLKEILKLNNIPYRPETSFTPHLIWSPDLVLSNPQGHIHCTPGLEIDFEDSIGLI